MAEIQALFGDNCDSKSKISEGHCESDRVSLREQGVMLSDSGSSEMPKNTKNGGATGWNICHRCFHTICSICNIRMTFFEFLYFEEQWKIISFELSMPLSLSHIQKYNRMTKLDYHHCFFLIGCNGWYLWGKSFWRFGCFSLDVAAINWSVRPNPDFYRLIFSKSIWFEHWCFL